MGMQQRVVLPGALPSWQVVRETLREQFDIVPEMRMIDGEIALPDEDPPSQWRELRVAFADGVGMITLKYGGKDEVDLVVWGNADQHLQQVWHQLTWVLAYLADGRVEMEGERYAADEFWTIAIKGQ